MSDIQPATIFQARAHATATLHAADIDTAALDARVLMAHVLGVSQTGLLLCDPEPMANAELSRFRDLIKLRATGVPVAYLTGYREFMGLQFATAPGVLVPRPDTEPLVEWGLAWLRAHPQAAVVDVRTGSGAIAISMVYHAGPSWTGTLIATDISEEALAIARRNAHALLSPAKCQRLQLQLGNLTQPLSGPTDLLLTNLPYLTPDQIEENPALRHEPQLALDGGTDGLDLVRRVIDDLPRILSPVGAVGFELDPSQSADVQHLLSKTLPTHQIAVVHDLAGNERHVVAYLRD